MTAFSKILREWRKLLINFSVSEPAIADTFEIIRQAYEEDGRYYHTLSHIEAVLQAVSDLKPIAHHYEVIQLSAWFHDIVYDSKASDNEVQSARLARRLMEQMGLPQRTIAQVGRMILATADHRNPDNDPDIDIMLDADLAVLGSDEVSYALYALNVNLEYSWVENDLYRQARIGVLRGFLERPSIYRTQPMIKRYEAQARENLEREIVRLST